MSLTTIIKSSIACDYEKALDGRNAVDNIPPSADLHLGSGTGAGAADLAFSDIRTLAPSTSENLDLAGVLVDAFGATLTFVKVKAIEICADKNNTTNLSFGGAGSNTFVGPFADPTDILVVKPGGRVLLADPNGWVVTPATGDILKVANAAGAPANYTIKIVGASA